MDPYKVLGVSQDASDDDVKTAYRRLVKKYHPDRYANDPEQQKQAGEKLKQINAAYDMIVKMRKGGYAAQNSGSPLYAQVRMYIQRGDLMTAQALLDQMQNRDAEWNYLYGIILFRRGWYDSAAQHFEAAYSMDPDNPDYQQAMQTMRQTAYNYEEFSQAGGNGASRWLNLCTTCACLGCAGLSCCTGQFYPLFCCC